MPVWHERRRKESLENALHYQGTLDTVQKIKEGKRLDIQDKMKACKERIMTSLASQNRIRRLLKRIRLNLSS